MRYLASVLVLLAVVGIGWAVGAFMCSDGRDEKRTLVVAVDLEESTGVPDVTSGTESPR